MLTFNRSTFRSGLMVVKVTVSEVESSFTLTPAQKGTNVDFGADPIRDAILAKYPAFFALPA